MSLWGGLSGAAPPGTLIKHCGSYVMPVFKNRLEELAADAVLASGLQRQYFLNQLRDMIKNTPIEVLAKEIAEITNLNELRMLQAAGVPAGAQPALMVAIARASGVYESV